MGPARSAASLALLLTAWTDALHVAPLVARAHRRAASITLCEDEPPQPTGDWRELRAKLVAQEQAEQRAMSDEEAVPIGEGEASGYVYESPLIEQGSVILGGTKQEVPRTRAVVACLTTARHREPRTRAVVACLTTARHRESSPRLLDYSPPPR
eukprot:6627736-Prymnesium_polylepis.1